MMMSILTSLRRHMNVASHEARLRTGLTWPTKARFRMTAQVSCCDFDKNSAYAMFRLECIFEDASRCRTTQPFFSLKTPRALGRARSATAGRRPPRSRGRVPPDPPQTPPPSATTGVAVGAAAGPAAGTPPTPPMSRITVAVVAVAAAVAATVTAARTATAAAADRLAAEAREPVPASGVCGGRRRRRYRPGYARGAALLLTR